MQEVGLRRVDIAALEFFLVGMGDRVDDEVDVVPGLADGVEGAVEAGALGDVAIDQQVRADRLGERPDAARERIRLVGEGQLGALAGGRAGDAPGDRMVVGDPHDEAAFAGHQPAWRGFRHICLPGGFCYRLRSRCRCARVSHRTS